MRQNREQSGPPVGTALARRGTFRLADAEMIARARGYVGVEDASDDVDILDLPEPLPAEHIPAQPSAAAHPARTRQFDYDTWSKDLDALLQCPLPAAHAPAPDTDDPDTYAEVPRALTGQRRERRASWKALAVLLIASLGVAGVLGGAAYGLASTDARIWLDGAGTLLTRLQVAISP